MPSRTPTVCRFATRRHIERVYNHDLAVADDSQAHPVEAVDSPPQGVGPLGVGRGDRAGESKRRGRLQVQQQEPDRGVPGGDHGLGQARTRIGPALGQHLADPLEAPESLSLIVTSTTPPGSTTAASSVRTARCPPAPADASQHNTPTTAAAASTATSRPSHRHQALYPFLDAVVPFWCGQLHQEHIPERSGTSALLGDRIPVPPVDRGALNVPVRIPDRLASQLGVLMILRMEVGSKDPHRQRHQRLEPVVCVGR